MAAQKQTDLNVKVLDLPFPITEKIERQLLADLATAPDVMGDVVNLIHPDFFTSPDRRGIWETVADHYEHGRAWDIASLSQLIGRPFIDEVIPYTISPATPLSALEHATLLRTGAARRRAYAAAAAFLQHALSPAAAEIDIIAAAEGFASGVEGPAPIQQEMTLAEAVGAVREDVKAAAAAEKEGRALRISTGFPRMDGYINGGFKPGQLVILAARPGVGKTSLMLHLARNAARLGFPVYISTLEMTGTELGEKFLLSTGRVRPADIAHGNVDWQEFDAAAAELEGAPVLINQFSRTLDQIVAHVTQAVKRGKCGIAFIDYLGLIQDTNDLGGGAKLYQIIARITGTLKAVAKRLGIPIVLLCQLNREQAREDRAPELYDLRDSGSIEQDADIVLMLENKWDNAEKRLRVAAWLRKNRGGRHTAGKGGVGFMLQPNDTYSGFEEVDVLGELEDLPDSTAQARAAATAPKPSDPSIYRHPDAFTESARHDEEDENLPF